MTIYVVNPIRRTDKEKGGNNQGQPAASLRVEEDNAHARRKTELKIKSIKIRYPLPFDRLVHTNHHGILIRSAARLVNLAHVEG